MGNSPVGKSPVGKSPVGKSPVGKSPVGKSPVGKSPRTKLSYRRAVETHNVKKSTLVDFIKGGMKEKKLGRKTLFTSAEEISIACLVDTVAEWGFPLCALEIRMMARDLLVNKNVTLETKDGLPGKDWFLSFAKRNRLSKRAASNMVRARSKVSADQVEEFFDKVDKVFCSNDDIRAENIYNYDETNFTNDPGKSIVFCRRGRKRVENAKESSKQSFSVMWCGNAAGELQPPMIVYKAKNVYEGWRKNGPPGALYESTDSGWFDSFTFRRWFLDLFLPSVKGKEGPIYLFGDNLSSHFSPELVEAALKHNVKFIMLIANATNWLQAFSHL